MSSFRWGMIACPTPTNSQVTVWKLRQPLFSLQIRIVLFTVLHSDCPLGSAGIPLHFGLSLCNLLEQIRLPYPVWKGTCSPIELSMVHSDKPFCCRVREQFALLIAHASYSDKMYQIICLAYVHLTLVPDTIILLITVSGAMWDVLH